MIYRMIMLVVLFYIIIFIIIFLFHSGTKKKKTGEHVNISSITRQCHQKQMMKNKNKHQITRCQAMYNPYSIVYGEKEKERKNLNTNNR